ncbi:GNAT family N-acetyltransferase [Mycobacterium botniense]|uniref:N-acetyltransferase domain-containing protein n=1 Tax=Mycobacterium botniense TaxID=84962 RepID=A0A7I9Y2P5_9MYCO|nr:GNAT family N-acetyltransferase [Mycobacterium botniense]GFG76247.1 hypothetical protein MBOT_36120 [Mycobacterium botniense]
MTENGWVDETSVRLRDGAAVQLRRLNDTDIDAVIELHDTLTDRERYLRFFTMHPTYLKTLAHKLTERNGKGYALGAFESGTLVGVANYVVSSKPDTAEVAVVVAHDDHMRGLGTTLLRRLAQIARHNGIRRFVADVLTTNYLMFKLLADAGLQPRHLRPSHGVVHLDVDLTGSASY